MSDKQYELARGRLGTSDILKPEQSVTSIPIVIRDATDELDGRTKALQIAPTQYDGLERASIDTVERINSSTFYFNVNYQSPDREKRTIEVGEYRISFDTSGASARILYGRGSESDVGKYTEPPATDKLEFGTAINVGDGRIDGADVVIPQLKIRVVKRQPGATITDAYVRTLAELTGKVNDATYLGYAAGELLFLGASGEQGGRTTSGGFVVDDDPEITYQFAVAFNQTDEVLDGITIASRKGHQFIWVYYDEDEIKAGLDVKFTGPKSRQINVVDVYDEADFTPLAI